MEEKNEPLRPRFEIQKRRIGGEEDKKDQPAADFSPEKVIYAEIDDEITTIFDRIKKMRQKKIAIVVPKRAVLLQSIVNLKILKKKFDELEKEVTIVTTDALGLQFAQKVGIPAIEKLLGKESQMTPIQAVASPLKGERPIRMSKEKVSLSEIIRPEGKMGIIGSLISKIKERFKKKKQTETRLVFIAPNKQALFTLILVSVLLLLAIAYIALPGATVYITPRSSVLDTTFNVSFLDFGKNRDVFENNTSNTIAIPTYPVRPPEITKKSIHYATGKIFKGQNASGIIIVTNLSNAPWDLSANTRFQTDSGLVFRIQEPVRIPAARANVPGTYNVAVVADAFDASGQVIGERGNIGPTKFFLPGLKNSENRKKLYGESKSGMTGGITQTVKMVSKEDVEAATQTVKKELNTNAINELKNYLEQQNLIKKTNFSLLPDRHAIQISDPVIEVPKGTVGTATDQFEITVSYILAGIAFDRQQLLDALKERLMTRVDPDKKIVSISEDDVSYRFLDQDEGAGKIRLTTTLRAIQAYELDPEKENGHRFIKKITDHIVGMNLKDAQEYLQQQTDEIAKVEITTWPIWAPTIPNVADNIKFVIKEENDL